MSESITWKEMVLARNCHFKIKRLGNAGEILFLLLNNRRNLMLSDSML